MEAFTVVTMLLAIAHLVIRGGAKDVCFGEESRISCDRGYIIIMTSAEYGHMPGGHCIEEEDPRYTGCKSDVLPLFDKWCSGKQECSFDTRTEELKKMNVNCPKFIIKFTRLEHTCVRVESECSSSKANILKHTKGYISSYITRTRRCGTRGSPWLISANPGQTIQLELIDFSASTQSSNLVSCRSVYGFIVERALGINHTICGRQDRQVTLYTSKTNRLEVQLVKNDQRNAAEYLLKYEVIGCAELSPPRNTWYKREGNKAIIGCENNDNEWTVTCSGNTWIGEIGNCTQTDIRRKTSAPQQNGIKLTSVVIMAAIIGSAFVLSVVAIVIGVVYVKKYRMHQETKRAALVHKTYSTIDRNVQAYYRPVTMDQSTDNRTPWDIAPSTIAEGQTLSSADQCTCATLQMRNNVDNDKRTEITSLERQSLYSSIKSN